MVKDLDEDLPNETGGKMDLCEGEESDEMSMPGLENVDEDIDDGIDELDILDPSAREDLLAETAAIRATVTKVSV